MPPSTRLAVRSNSSSDVTASLISSKILVAEAEENNLDVKEKNRRWKPWNTCSLCEQLYHGVVKGALGWACWKTYVGRPETNVPRLWAMTELGNGLSEADRDEDALSVREAELSMLRRLGASEHSILIAQGNLAISYRRLGRREEAMCLRRDVYSGFLKIHGEEHYDTIREASNYADTLVNLERFEEVKALMRKMMPVARRVLRESHDITLKMDWIYAEALYKDPAATLDDLREAMTSLIGTERTARRVLGGAHPLTPQIEDDLQDARAALRARETQP